MTVEVMAGEVGTGETLNEEGHGMRADARRNRERILKVAMQRFACHGVSTSLEEIAREAGVGAGTLYRHFPSREALLAAALQDRQAQLLALSAKARQIADADAALAAWLEGLQSYLRSFNGLPDPVLSAIRQHESPLTLSCDRLVSITAEFLSRAQNDGHARASVTANDLFFAALSIAWVLNRTNACGISSERLNAILSHGYMGKDDS